MDSCRTSRPAHARPIHWPEQSLRRPGGWSNSGIAGLTRTSGSETPLLDICRVRCPVTIRRRPRYRSGPDQRLQCLATVARGRDGPTLTARAKPALIPASEASRLGAAGADSRGSGPARAFRWPAGYGMGAGVGRGPASFTGMIPAALRRRCLSVRGRATARLPATRGFPGHASPPRHVGGRARPSGRSVPVPRGGGRPR